MKKTKFVSIVTAMVMSICVMLGSLSTASACSGCNPPTDEVHGMGVLPVYYTLEQLFEMSDEDFFALPYSESYYNEIKNDFNKRGGLSGKVWTWLYEEDENVKYTANVTEMEIEELLGDAVKYEIDSPISLDTDYLMNNFLYYGNILMVVFPEYDLYSQTSDITDNDIIEMTKCWYCVNQVIEINYWHFLDVLSDAPSEEQVLSGDVNFDKSVNIYDIIWIASDLADIFKLTEAQKQIGDVNGDDVCDLYDAIAMAETLMK